MRTIQFNKNITFEQYQMAVLGLEAIGLEVKKEELSAEVIEGIEQEWKELHGGKEYPVKKSIKKRDYYVQKSNMVSKSSKEIYFNFGILDRT